MPVQSAEIPFPPMRSFTTTYLAPGSGVNATKGPHTFRKPVFSQEMTDVTAISSADFTVILFAFPVIPFTRETFPCEHKSGSPGRGTPLRVSYFLSELNVISTPLTSCSAIAGGIGRPANCSDNGRVAQEANATDRKLRITRQEMFTKFLNF